MKGTMSELELSLFRQRSQEALRQMARRGDLVLGVAVGYVKVGRGRIEKDPDQRVQQAMQLVFTKFAEFQSGSETKGSNCPPNRGGARRTASCGACRPTTSCTTS
jgi:DNA invertase Pin-like site-specific DNA recombinase